MRGRVLVVDDDVALAEMLGIVLRGEGFDLTIGDGNAGSTTMELRAHLTGIQLGDRPDDRNWLHFIDEA